MAAIHLRPTAALAPRVLLPGDPGRALALAQELLEGPKMFNHNRGLWGYTGPAKADGEPLSIQSTGMGGPSAAIVLEELASLGVREAIRVGTCGALDPSLSLGDLVLARETIAADGVGAALARAAESRVADTGKPRIAGAAEQRLAADERLTAALQRAATPEASGTIVTTDLFYEPPDAGREARWAQAGALAIEMEAAALFAVGGRRGVAVACLLTVSDVFAGAGFAGAGERERIDDEPLLAASLRMGAAAVAALAPEVD
ncbi:MAG TPA: hypothetical protein VGF95_06780 [Solirubrobacteraceae bacterium]|jgi:DeoD family purine-nucleoside phosphorylase